MPETDYESLAAGMEAPPVGLDPTAAPGALPGGPAPPPQPIQSPEREDGPVDWETIAREIESPPPAPPPEVISQSETGADISDIAVASLANDPQAQIRYFAQQRGIPEDRYSIVEGQIVYQGDDGKLYREVPEASFSDPTTIAQGLATGVGPSMPLVAGTAAGIATAPALLAGPAGLAASVAATGGAAVAGQTAREALASYLMDQEISPARIGMEGAYAAAGQGVGAGMTRWAQRGLAKDIGRLDPRKVQEIERVSAVEDIPLTPAEKTGLPSLQAQQKALGNLPQSSDEMAEFYRARAGKVNSAIRRFLDRLSPEDSAETAGDLARAASRGAMGTVAKNRAAQAKPHYQRAFAANPEVDVGSVIDKIDEGLETAKGGIKAGLNRARDLLVREIDDLDDAGKKITKMVPEDRLDALHQAKMALDDMIDNAADTSLGRTARRRLRDVKGDLLEAMDAASPDYQSGRAIFADLSPGTVRVAEGLVGKVAGLTQRNAKDAARILLGPASGPRAVTEARRLIGKENPEAWQAVKRSFIEDIFEKAQNETMTGQANVAGKFRKAIFGNPQQRDRLKAALTAPEWKAMKQLATALDAASSVKQIGSDTAWNQEAMRMMRETARPVYARIARNLNPAQALRSFEEWATERNLGKNASRLAGIITDPDGMDMLRELKRLPSGSIRARVILGHMLTATAGEGVEALETELTGP